MLDIKPDDNCLFGAFAQRFLGNQNRHQDVREKEREFLLAHADDPSYAWMLAEIQAEAAAGGKVFTSVVAYADYIQKPKVWGGEFDIRVLQLANGVDSTVIHTIRNDRICFSVVTPAGDLPTTSKNAIELTFIGGNHWNLVRLIDDVECTGTATAPVGLDGAPTAHVSKVSPASATVFDSDTCALATPADSARAKPTAVQANIRSLEESGRTANGVKHLITAERVSDDDEEEDSDDSSDDEDIDEDGDNSDDSSDANEAGSDGNSASAIRGESLKRS